MNSWKRPNRCPIYSKLNDKTLKIINYLLLRHLNCKTYPHNNLFFKTPARRLTDCLMKLRLTSTNKFLTNNVASLKQLPHKSETRSYARHERSFIYTSCNNYIKKAARFTKNRYFKYLLNQMKLNMHRLVI
jgi:hypothetical protein